MQHSPHSRRLKPRSLFADKQRESKASLVVSLSLSLIGRGFNLGMDLQTAATFGDTRSITTEIPLAVSRGDLNARKDDEEIAGLIRRWTRNMRVRSSKSKRAPQHPTARRVGHNADGEGGNDETADDTISLPRESRVGNYDSFRRSCPAARARAASSPTSSNDVSVVRSF